jgi:DNA-binding LytR/AlgR family response regulator
VKVLVVAQEMPARTRLARMLSRVENVEVVGDARDFPRALERIDTLRPDLVLLDADMPGLDQNALGERAERATVIQVTTCAHFEANGEYLLKPVTRERLARAIGIVRNRRGEEIAPAEPWRLTIHDGPRLRFVDARTISRFYSTHKYTGFVSDGRELFSRESLSTLERRLEAFGFVRVHRAQLVRRDAIVQVTSEANAWLLHLCSGEVVRVSRRRMGEVERALGLAGEAND